MGEEKNAHTKRARALCTSGNRGGSSLFAPLQNDDARNSHSGRCVFIGLSSNCLQLRLMTQPFIQTLNDLPSTMRFPIKPHYITRVFIHPQIEGESTNNENRSHYRSSLTTIDLLLKGKEQYKEYYHVIKDAVDNYLQTIGLDTNNIDGRLVKRLAEQFRVSRKVAILRLREFGYYVPYIPFS